MSGYPDFLIIGAAKAGTTALFDILREHPQLFLPELKEPHHFAFRHDRPDLVAPDGRYVGINDRAVTDPDQYLARTGRRPVVHLDALGVLGPHLLLAHGVHIDDEEVALILASSTAVASCPWAYLRLGQGITSSFRHLDLWAAGGRLALGCDSENSGDAVDGLRAATLFAGLAKDVPVDPTRFTALDALTLLTIGGAEAIGMADHIGSLEVGKQADVVVHDRSGAAWSPVADDPVQQLVWGSDGRSVREVWIAGRPVVTDGSVTSVDAEALAHAGREAGKALMRRASVGS
jgi:5-methylthioadenosine/S-adenosylhomocysteine deaminase